MQSSGHLGPGRLALPARRDSQYRETVSPGPHRGRPGGREKRRTLGDTKENTDRGPLAQGMRRSHIVTDQGTCPWSCGCRVGRTHPLACLAFPARLCSHRRGGWYNHGRSEHPSLRKMDGCPLPVDLTGATSKLPQRPSPRGRHGGRLRSQRQKPGFWKGTASGGQRSPTRSSLSRCRSNPTGVPRRGAKPCLRRAGFRWSIPGRCLGAAPTIMVMELIRCLT